MARLSDKFRIVSSFTRRQAVEIHQGGLRVMLRKSRAALEMALSMALVLVVRAVRPLVLIRFGRLRSERIGHFASNTELYLCERDAGMHPPRTLDVFYYRLPVCNQQLKKMWERVLCVSRFAPMVAGLNRLLPGHEQHVVTMPSDRDVHGLLERTPAHLHFNTREEQRGRHLLAELGVPDGAPFVCFYARDPAYLRALFPGRDLSYHDYRDCSIHSYIPAAEELVRLGYYTIRMGAAAREELRINNPRLIDYAALARTDFMDIYLCAKCRFFLGSSGGLCAVPVIFRVPVAHTNLIPLEYACNQRHDLFIPKKLWLREESRFLTFREILDSGIGRFLLGEQYEQLGVEVIENTPEEIAALAVEMHMRLAGTWRTTGTDEELQRRFWSLFKPGHLCYGNQPRMGAEFLRRNRALLE